MMRHGWAKLRAIVGCDTIDNELREELDAHLQMEVEANIDRGMTPAQALEAATRHLGNRRLIQEMAHEAWTFDWLEALRRDLRQALRILRRSRGFTLAALIVLALGIGVNTAVFDLVHTLLFAPPPFAKPSELVQVFSQDTINPKSYVAFPTRPIVTFANTTGCSRMRWRSTSP